MQLHQITPKTKRQVSRRIARGGKRGKTSGRGGKGQTARAGNSTRPEMRDIIKKLPKLRGFGKNRAKTVNNSAIPASVVNVTALETAFENGDAVNPQALVGKGLVSARSKRAPKVKILGTGGLTKKLTVTSCTVSASAKALILKAGGTVV